MTDTYTGAVKILYLEDDLVERRRVQSALTTLGDSSVELSLVNEFSTFEEQLNSEFDIVLVDIHLQEEKSGFDAIALAKRKAPEAIVIVRSSDLTAVERAMYAGAVDFIEKSADEHAIRDRLEICWRTSTRYQTAKSSQNYAGKTMQTIAARVPRILNSAISAVHITGETGTGKEVVAKLFQDQLGRGVPFLSVNCSALSPNLVDSEFFGHVKGAFTGAGNDRKGIFESAHGGWVFLDEVGELSLEHQAKLLRFLETGEIRPVGSDKTKVVNVKVISATNVSLADKVVCSEFRQDLMQRLCETEIRLPPLRERLGELDSLLSYFCRSLSGGPYRLTPAAKQILRKYTWEMGNVRELRNCLRAMTENAVDKMLTPFAVPEAIRLGMRSLTRSTSSKHFLQVPYKPKDTYQTLCDKLLVETIQRMRDEESSLSIRAIAERLDMSRTTIRTRVNSLVESQEITAADKNRLMKR